MPGAQRVVGLVDEQGSMKSDIRMKSQIRGSICTFFSLRNNIIFAVNSPLTDQAEMREQYLTPVVARLARIGNTLSTPFPLYLNLGGLLTCERNELRYED